MSATGVILCNGCLLIVLAGLVVTVNFHDMMGTRAAVGPAEVVGQTVW